jgi:hypothetical protein
MSIDLQNFMPHTSNTEFKGLAFKPADRDLTAELPDELLFSIFAWLDPKTCLSSLSLVCKRWKVLADDDFLWKYFLKNELGIEPQKNQTDLKNYYRQINPVPFLPNLQIDKGEPLNWEKVTSSGPLPMSSDQKSLIWYNPNDQYFYFEGIKSPLSPTPKKIFQRTPWTNDLVDCYFSDNGKKIIGTVVPEKYHQKLTIWDSKLQLIKEFPKIEGRYYVSSSGNTILAMQFTSFTVYDLNSNFSVTIPFVDTIYPKNTCPEPKFVTLSNDTIIFSRETFIYLFSISSKKKTHEWQFPKTIDYVALSPSGKKFSAYDHLGRLRVHSILEDTFVEGKLRKLLTFVKLKFITEDLLIVTGVCVRLMGPRNRPHSQLWQIHPDKLELIKEYDGELIANGSLLKQFDGKQVTLKSYMPHIN